MMVSILQLNINSDNYWEELVAYINSRDFDVIQLQEVTGKDSVSGNIDSQIDCFEELKKILGDKYHGEIAIATRFTSSPTSYMGNATFYKKEFSLVEKNIIDIYKTTEPYPSDAEAFDYEGRSLLHLELSIQGKNVSFLNTHLAWAKTPKEEPHQTEQAKILVQYLQTLSTPFILTGDFNIDPEQPTIQKINALAKNLTTKFEITNTLNPRTHRAKVLFPKGVAVDYIFVTEDIDVENFSVIDEDLSDHFGLFAELHI